MLKPVCHWLPAGMDQVGLGKTTALGWAVLTAAIGGLCLAAKALWQTENLAARAIAAAPALLAVLLVTAIVRTLSLGTPRDAQTGAGAPAGA